MAISKIRDDLFVTDIGSIRTQSLSGTGVNLVVNICGDSTADNVGCDYRQFDIRDGTHTYDIFSAAVEAILNAWDEDKSVLVHCHAGQSRSVSASAAALSVDENINLYDAYDRIRSERIIHPSPELTESANQFVDNRDSGSTEIIKDIIEKDRWALCG